MLTHTISYEHLSKLEKFAYKIWTLLNSIFHNYLHGYTTTKRGNRRYHCWMNRIVVKREIKIIEEIVAKFTDAYGINGITYAIEDDYECGINYYTYIINFNNTEIIPNDMRYGEVLHEIWEKYGFMNFRTHDAREDLEYLEEDEE